MRTLLCGLFTIMLIGMLAITIWATQNRGMLEAGSELVRYPWFIATLSDAYFAFLAFYSWLAWREDSWAHRCLWFVLIMCLGSMAIASYMLLQLYRRRGQPAASIWQRG